VLERERDYKVFFCTHKNIHTYVFQPSSQPHADTFTIYSHKKKKKKEQVNNKKLSREKIIFSNNVED